MRDFNSAPLPFMGQKRRFARAFKRSISEIKDAKVVVELFGGSGLLSHISKFCLPDAQVVYNDYDGFRERLANVDRTNEMLRGLREIVSGVPSDKRVPDDVRGEILRFISSYEKSGFVDYITLGSSLLFSGKRAICYDELAKHTMYNRVKMSNYDVEGYLEGVEIVSEDYKSLYAKFKDVEGVVFLVDPPYLSTDVGQYKCYWKLGDYLDVLNVLEAKRYFYFTSNKSQIIELCGWIRDNIEGGCDPFNGAEVVTVDNNINYDCGYTDIMLIKR